jgi:hypothetical protein
MGVHTQRLLQAIGCETYGGSENRHEFFLVAAYWVAYASAVWFVCGVFVMCALVWEFC